MSYYVSLGNIELEQVASVTQSRSRDITVYDGVGSGKFSVPQSKGLRSWSIKCDISDYDTIKALEKMQKKNTPVRLVINAPDYKVSERVLLKEHSAQQDYADVFSVSISLMEYAKASVLTTDVPFVVRPGKAPALPKTVTINYEKNVTPHLVIVAAKRTEESPYGPLPGVLVTEEPLSGEIFLDPEILKRVNPADIKNGQTVSIDQNKTPVGYTGDDELERISYENSMKAISAAPGIGKAFMDYMRWAGRNGAPGRGR